MQIQFLLKKLCAGVFTAFLALPVFFTNYSHAENRSADAGAKTECVVERNGIKESIPNFYKFANYLSENPAERGNYSKLYLLIMYWDMTYKERPKRITKIITKNDFNENKIFHYMQEIWNDSTYYVVYSNLYDNSYSVLSANNIGNRIIYNFIPSDEKKGCWDLVSMVDDSWIQDETILPGALDRFFTPDLHDCMPVGFEYDVTPGKDQPELFEKLGFSKKIDESEIHHYYPSKTTVMWGLPILEVDIAMYVYQSGPDNPPFKIKFNASPEQVVKIVKKYTGFNLKIFKKGDRALENYLDPPLFVVSDGGQAFLYCLAFPEDPD